LVFGVERDEALRVRFFSIAPHFDFDARELFKAGKAGMDTSVPAELWFQNSGPWEKTDYVRNDCFGDRIQPGLRL